MGRYPRLTTEGANLIADARRIVTGADGLKAKALTGFKQRFPPLRCGSTSKRWERRRRWYAMLGPDASWGDREPHEAKLHLTEHESQAHALTTGLLVVVAVMQVRIVRMRMDQSHVRVVVDVRCAGRDVGTMRVPVMRVMDMGVGVLHRFMDVFVAVAFCEMQIEPDRHQHCRHDQSCGHGLAEQYDRQDRPDERC